MAVLAAFSVLKWAFVRDPTSPFLFIICSEFLSKLLIEEDKHKNLNGIRVFWIALVVFHFYVADILISCCTGSRNA